MDQTPHLLPEHDTRTPLRWDLTTTLVLVLLALFLSGIAAVINQTVWQRALIIYVAGSEAISSMIVVLVFMLGLGVGSLYMGRHAHRMKNPMGSLGLVELGLFAANLLVALLLSIDITETAVAFQRAAVSLGIPLRLLYVLVSTVVLIVPCFLMGITMPMVSEAVQRQVKMRDPRFLTVLFFLNTLGAVAGALVSGFVLLPYLGQHKALLFAAGFNALGALILLWLYATRYRIADPAVPFAQPQPRARLAGLRRVEIVAFFLGFLALAYEMYLFRIATVSFEPLPYTFSTALCFYLLFWSVGVFLAKRLRLSLALCLTLTALAIMLIPLLTHYRVPRVVGGGVVLFSAVFAVPCIGFGLVFGQLVTEVTRHWGNDVGRFYGMNTLGSCLGILAGTLVGYEIHHTYLAWSIALGYVLLMIGELRRRRGTEPEIESGWALPLSLALVFGVWIGHAPAPISDQYLAARGLTEDRTYFGREGVVEIRDGKNLIWNGLWHSELSQGDHVGEQNWLQAVIPYLCHEGTGDKETLVIGVSTGLTAATLAKSSRIQSVEGYEINPTLKEVMEDYPDGTLGIAENPKVEIIWQDARIGMTLDEKKFDIITQAPLYLRQAGSSILLSKEYMQLVRSRLKPGGVLAIYCHSWGNYGQAMIVRRTASEVFSYGESFLDGYLLVVSDAPLDCSFEAFERRFLASGDDPFTEEILQIGLSEIAGMHDNPRLDWLNSPVIITNDHPIIEYPDIANRVVADFLATKKMR